MGTAMHKLGKTAMVLAVALLLMGGFTVSAGAAPRSQGISNANASVLNCLALGGDPVVQMDTTGESLTVYCRWPNGQVSVCQFLPVEKDCTLVTPLKPTERPPSKDSR